jgi:hypothetical protein
VVEILTDSPNPRDYWYRIKQREKISGIELSTICRQFKLGEKGIDAGEFQGNTGSEKRKIGSNTGIEK